MSARTTSLAFVTVAFFGLTGSSLAACAGSEEPAVDDPVVATDAGATKDAAPADAAKPPVTPPADAAPKDTCAPSCSTDDQCKNSCTVPSSGTYCCDKAVSKCFKYTAAACPGPVEPPDSSTPPPTSP